MADYERVIRLSEHDPSATEGAEIFLLKVCQAHTNRYLQTFQRAALPAKLREECVIAPVSTAAHIWEAAISNAGDGITESRSFLDVSLAKRSGEKLNAAE